jgi:hypothetical protein
MRTRRLRWRLVGLAVVIAAGMVVLWLQITSPRPVSSIRLAAFQLLKPGMTLAQVTAIIGPPGDYRTMKTEDDLPSGPEGYFFGRQEGTFGPIEGWQSDNARIIVSFHETGRVQSGEFFPQRPSTESNWSKVFWQVNHQWHRWYPEK